MSIPVLNPGGPIGQQERRLIILAVVLSAIVVIPVYIMLISFAWRYREGNKKARYDPEFDHSRGVEFFWWAVPLIIITILAVATWNGSYKLSPFRPLDSRVKPLTIQVVALQWRWLFIYPQQNIAAVNLVQFPQKTPVNFEITADAPMNSFWIPGLGGQIYAMSGMSTNLHLMADHVATYHGSSANISGEGFASMEFMARSTTESDFANWAVSIQRSPNNLTLDAYNQLSQPSSDSRITYFSTVEPDLYHNIVMKFMDPNAQMPEMSNNMTAHEQMH